MEPQLPNDGDRIYNEVMCQQPSPSDTPFQRALIDFVFGDVWSRGGLTKRERRWVTLVCVAAADSALPIDEHVLAALESGDVPIEAMLEFVLHFAVYCGWPKASHLEMIVLRSRSKLALAAGNELEPLPRLSESTLGPSDWSARLERGVQEFVDVNLQPAPPPDTPYRQAGILNFVFGHVWQRPGLTRKERRIITVACVALLDSPTPLRSHVTAALHSGDVTKSEMDEIVLHFAVYYGFAKGQQLAETVEAAWAARN